MNFYLNAGVWATVVWGIVPLSSPRHVRFSKTENEFLEGLKIRG